MQLHLADSTLFLLSLVFFDWESTLVTPQNVTLMRNVTTFDPKCNINPNCNNFLTQNVTTFLTQNVTTQNVTTLALIYKEGDLDILAFLSS